MKYLLRIHCHLHNSTLIVIAVVMSFCSLSCKKFLDISDPPTNVMGDLAFEDDNSAISTVVGIYSDMMQLSKAVSMNTTLYASLNSDEMTTRVASSFPFVQNDIDPSLGALNTFWVDFYSYIYNANAVIEGLQKSSKLTPPVKDQLMGEALFIRAFVHFYLTNFFGDVPLVTTTDVRVNATSPRARRSEVYNQIINDLKEAKNLLKDSYPTSEKVRPNKWTAAALLARVYLYIGDWQNAEIMASAIINSGLYSPLASPNNVFLKTSEETIWQLMPVSAVYVWDGVFFTPSSNPTSIPAYQLRTSYVSAFETGDQRRVAWIGTKTVSGNTYYYPAKYKVTVGASSITEYKVVFRLAEQYLIRAEALAEQNKLIDAIADLNIVRSRAELGALSTNLSQGQVLDAVEQERKAELFAEWGHRWFDLKRTGKANTIIAATKGSSWQATDTLYPIPAIQLGSNPSLTQNPGY